MKCHIFYLNYRQVIESLKPLYLCITNLFIVLYQNILDKKALTLYLFTYYIVIIKIIETFIIDINFTHLHVFLVLKFVVITKGVVYGCYNNIITL